MSSFFNKYIILAFVSFITIGIFGQEKVTEPSSFSKQESFKNVIPVSSLDSKMPIHNPDYVLDTQINQTLINDTDPIIMPIYKPYLSLERKQLSAASFATARLKTIDEIRKSLNSGKVGS